MVRNQETFSFHRQTLAEIENEFGTNLSSGLDTQTVNLRLKQNGKNQLSVSSKHILANLVRILFSGFAGFLWIVAILSILAYKPLGRPPDPVNLIIGIALILITFVQTFFFVLQDWSSHTAMRSIAKLAAERATVVRDGGQKQKVSAAGLVVGDVLLLAGHGRVPADARLFEARNLRLDKSMLTGETDHIDATSAKYTADDTVNYTEVLNMAFMGSLVAAGEARGIVVSVGDKTVLSDISRLTSTKVLRQTTELQRDVNRFTLLIIGMVLLTSALNIVLWMTVIRYQHLNYSYLELLTDIISITISFIPFGMPIAISVSLWLNARKMKQNQVLVKNITAIETLSSVNVIASDKTGTLTQNKMHVSSVMCGMQSVDPDACYVDSVVYIGMNEAIKQLLAICALCNNARFYREFRVGNPTDLALLSFAQKNLNLGKTLERAYKQTAEIEFNSSNKYHVKLLHAVDVNVHNFVFGSRAAPTADKSPAGTVASMPTPPPPQYPAAKYLLLVKGAPDVLVTKCHWIIEPNGTQSLLTTDKMRRLIQVQNFWCSLGRRVVILCKKSFSEQQVSAIMARSSSSSSGSGSSGVDSDSGGFEKYFRTACNDLCVMGIVGMVDPPRAGMLDVIGECRKAGIRVMMITGDYQITAAAISSEVGILTCGQFKYDTLMSLRGSTSIHTHASLQSLTATSLAPTAARFGAPRLPHSAATAASAGARSVLSANSKKFEGSIVLSGKDVDLLTKDEWKLVCNKYQEIVIARSTPEHKLKVVRAFQSHGFVVGMTGDGINDAPALKNADIGIAMGAGSEVAMEAAHIILLDNSFAYITISIENGRLAFDNIRKVVLFMLPCGVFSLVIASLVNLVFGSPAILSSYQMLILMLGTDLVSAITLIFEKPEENLLGRPPRSGSQRLVNAKLIAHGFFFIGLMMAVFSHFTFFLYMYWYGGFWPSDLFFVFDKSSVVFDGLTEDQPDVLLRKAQTSTFVSLAVMQTFGNTFCTRTRYLSLYQSFPLRRQFRNVSLFVSIFINVIIVVVLVYSSFFNSILGMAPVPLEFVAITFLFALFIIGMEEGRKQLIARNILPKKYAW